MKISQVTRRSTVLRWAAVAVASCAALLAGCPNPNAIGVQQTGSVKVTCVQASNNQPVAGALVSISATQVDHTGNDGTVVIANVPVGPQNVTADAPGLHGGPVAVPGGVSEGATAQVTVPMYPT